MCCSGCFEFILHNLIVQISVFACCVGLILTYAYDNIVRIMPFN